LAKVLYLQNKNDTGKVAKLIKTVNYMNRMLVEKDNDFSLNKRKSKEDYKNTVSQTDPMEERVQIVEKEVYVEVKVEKEVEKMVPAKEETTRKDDIIKDFWDEVRRHSIKVLMRENPDKAGYYSIVWKNQTNEELLRYKLPNVFEEVPEDGIEDEDREDYDTLNVFEYFKLLFKTLENKLILNVTRLEKEDLDIKKWIWNGDIHAHNEDE
jgi:hypothetical protein